ncbi:MAG: DNA-processing protein DprA [Pseudomonadota bacterium]
MHNLFTNSQATPPNHHEKIHWLRLFRTQNIGPITFYKLLDRFGSAQEALKALPELSKKGGRKKPLEAPPIQAIEKEYEKLLKLGGDIICANEEFYPLALSATDDAPPVLSYLGHLNLLRPPCLSIVGARNASLNGKKFAQKLAKELGESGQIIASGLARGIDTAVHHGAIETGTIAVVAGGIDVVYPRENQGLYEEIKAKGLILAESPLGMEPIARHFPKRNRIVSGLSAGTIVIEATVRSGSLITARLAGEQGRDVYAVPGYPGDPRAQGPNKLIQDGAVLVQKASDILDKLVDFSGDSYISDSANSTLEVAPANDDIDDQTTDEIKNSVLQNMSQYPVDIDELSRACHVSIPNLQYALLELELGGRLQRLAGNRVVLLDEV